MSCKYFLIGILSYFSMHLHAQSELLSDKFEQILSAPEFKHAGVSCSVYDIEEENLVLGINENMSLVPASSLKLITTLSALDLLGEDFRFQTKISMRGELLDDGTLEGDIFIEGDGDPSLGTSDFKETLDFEKLLQSIAEAIQTKGINCIDGDIIADESVFNSFPVNPTWQWNDLGNYYASGAWGINVFENEYHIYFQQTEKIGATPAIHHYYPKVPGLELQNEVETDSANTGDNAYIFGGPYNYQKRIVGTIPAGKELFRIKGSIPDPPYFFVYHLQRVLAKMGIQSNNIQTHFVKKKKSGRTTIHSISSPSLDKLAKKANFESNNLYCESLLKRLGYEKKGEGSGEIGKRVIRNLLRKKAIATDGLNMVDGSGLSARNQMSSFVMARFLDKMIEDLGLSTVKTMIPKAGYQGTVSSMLNGSKAKGHVWAKSGSMERVLSYSGIIEARSGKIYTFSFISNGHSVKNSRLSGIMQQLMNSVYELG